MFHVKPCSLSLNCLVMFAVMDLAQPHYVDWPGVIWMVFLDVACTAHRTRLAFDLAALLVLASVSAGDMFLALGFG